MKRCEEISGLLSAYFDGELKRDQKALVEGHLGQCENCGRQLESYRKIDEAARRRAVQMPSDDEWETLWRHIEEGIAPAAGDEYGEGKGVRRQESIPFWELLRLHKRAVASVAAALVIAGVLVIFGIIRTEEGADAVLPLASAAEVVQGEVEIDSNLYTPVLYKEGGVDFIILVKRGEVDTDSGVI